MYVEISALNFLILSNIHFNGVKTNLVLPPLSKAR